MTRPPIWQLIRDAVEPLGREVSYAEVKKILWTQYPDLNEATINCQLIICSVNAPSRVHYPENKKPRRATGQYDFLFNTGRGRVVWYDPAKYGLWEIALNDEGALCVRQVESATDELAAAPIAPTGSSADEGDGVFALESHLRDYLAKNLPTLPGHSAPLQLYVDAEGRDGVEYQTDVGPIDLLALDSEKNFVVLELKLRDGPDKALGQILRYMGWIKNHRAGDKNVSGVILASQITKKLKYAATQVPHVGLMEYRLAMTLKPVALEK
jgi:hypothetical protein